MALNDTIMVLAFAPIVELLLGLSSGAVVGVQIEVPVMLLVVRVVNRFRGWY